MLISARFSSAFNTNPAANPVVPCVLYSEFMPSLAVCLDRFWMSNIFASSPVSVARHTPTNHPPIIANLKACVVLAAFMSVNTMSFGGSIAKLLAAPKILFLRHWFNVARINACWVPAQMVHDQSVRNRTIQKNPNCSVQMCGDKGLPIATRIAQFISCFCPPPTSIWQGYYRRNHQLIIPHTDQEIVHRLIIICENIGLPLYRAL